MSRITAAALRNMAQALDQDLETTELEWRRFWIGMGKVPEIVGNLVDVSAGAMRVEGATAMRDARAAPECLGIDMGDSAGGRSLVVDSVEGKKLKFWLVNEEGDARLNAHLEIVSPEKEFWGLDRVETPPVGPSGIFGVFRGVWRRLRGWFL